MARERLLVLVTGSGPGLGKSTLAERLAESLSDSGQSVELFRELEIEDDPAFVDVMREFRSTGEASRSLLSGTPTRRTLPTYADLACLGQGLL
jgi:Mrp family chromosome partitioning ATPase